MAKYYQPEIETASPEQLRAWQNERLVEQVRHVWDNVPYYRKKMEEKGLTPDDIRGKEDLYKLPFLLTSTYISSDNAFTTEAPTPCNPPETL